MILKINREICADDDKMHLWYEGRDGISFNDIDEAITANANDDTIELLMDSLGGDCNEGFAIYDKLRSTGKHIKAVIQGKCASMASVILLAASERKAFPHASLQIHKPFLSFATCHFSLADAEAAKAQLEDLNEKILSIYEERTGTSREILESIMNEDRSMTAEEARELGFIQEIMLPASASAYNNNFNKKSMDKKKTMNAVQTFLKAIGLDGNLNAKDYVIETEDGNEINVDIEQGTDFKVGDPATPDGTFVLKDGRTLVITDGVIAEIKPAEDEEKEELKAKVAELEKQLEEAKTKDAVISVLKANAKSEQDMKVLDFVEKAGGFEQIIKMQSTYKPESRETETQAKDIVKETSLERLVRERREKVYKKSKLE